MAVSTEMLEYKKSLVFHFLVKSCHLRFNIMSPVFQTHNQSILLSPVISEINTIEVIFQSNIN